MTENQKKLGLKTIFMGSSFIAEAVLRALIQNGYNIQAVLTKPEKDPGDKNSDSVKTLAEKSQIPVIHPIDFDAEIISALKKIKPDLIIVSAYGKIIPKEVLDIPAFGSINFHPSLLPRWRGPSPVQNAILNGDKETGITIMLMDEKMDTGDILAQKKVGISPDDTSADLYKKLLPIGIDLLLSTVSHWTERKIQSIPQDNARATYCQLIEREDGHVFWDRTTDEIYRQFRALHPWPGVFSFWDNNGSMSRIKFHSIKPSEVVTSKEDQISGEVVKIGDQLAVRTLDGAVVINQIQPEGKKLMSTQEFLNGYSKIIGCKLK